MSTEGEALRCILKELHCTTAVLVHLVNTRAIDGRQEDQWGDMTASWIYDPNNGTNMIIRKA